ncbi:hypothetical protein DVJ77_13755 [Dyella tabacisoli]|uniref:Uncharacterized protein n=1 Tax=Dyella tabacisoli TaxID=2282381 RepID=A0A369ULG2_9GAMM|nr:hypothetical protein DVJ77_13755 [Dyella tabacisoli]
MSPTLQSYATPKTATLGYRKAPTRSGIHLDKQIQRIEQRITRRIVHEIAQASPSREQVEKAMLTPRLVHALAEKVVGIMAQRSGLERYRRGL